MESVISLQKVSKEYHLDERTTVPAVHNLNLNIGKGDFVIVIGRSGSGKTTLLNLAAGLIRPTGGHVLIDGTDLWSLNDSSLSLLRNEKIGFTFQFPSLMPSLTSLENVVLPTMFGVGRAKNEAYDNAAKLLKTMGLGDRMNAYPRQLSAGQQKRVVIARALINRPQILLSDEPTSDLDERTEEEMMGLLKEIHDTGVTVLMVTHSLELVAHASRAYEMEAGLLREITNPADVCAAARNRRMV